MEKSLEGKVCDEQLRSLGLFSLQLNLVMLWKTRSWHYFVHLSSKISSSVYSAKENSLKIQQLQYKQNIPDNIPAK